MFNLFGKKRGNEFRFKEPENTACFTCSHVLDEKLPILYVAHHAEDGFWSFLCGQSNHSEANAKVISLKQATEIDSTVNDLYEMPLGVGADRDRVGAKWNPFKL